MSPEEWNQHYERMEQREAEFQATGRRYGRPGRRADDISQRMIIQDRDPGDETQEQETPCTLCGSVAHSAWRCSLAPGGIIPINGADILGWNKVHIGQEAAQQLQKRQSLPTDPKARKDAPICRGLLDYFPLACAEVAALSYAATQQHHPDKPMHWDRTKSTDHADCIVRHLVDRGTRDSDDQRHTAKVAWRALALLETELEQTR